MYAIYGNIYHQYTPVMLAYIPAPWILWDTYHYKAHTCCSYKAQHVYPRWTPRELSRFTTGEHHHLGVS